MHKINACTVRCQNLDFYRGSQLIFRDVSLLATPGSILMIRGSNGSGKTSLLRLIAGFSHPQNGTIEHCFDDKIWLNGPAIGQIGWLGHKNGIKGELSILENLALWKAAGTSADELQQILQKLGLKNLQSQPAHTLSAGQQRRLALARLLVGQHPIWMMDEPSANLDKDGSRLIEQLLVEHTANNGTAIIASHDPLHPNAPVSFIKLLCEAA
ncbi:hypothetical protein MNBD_ALPHA06-1855 [hydrothermal vent metagenome]|uniref:ABC transporter domain-containing protein n=1 Tax=hydrothermal vent metagenome TaxID=652676 RepID=A0A3B0SY07_9ZZZZ